MNDQAKFLKNSYQSFPAIEFCMENKLVFPALTLIYSGIDTFAWVAYGDIGVEDRYTKWVKNYMYKEKPLSPRPIDLYAARCAILHTLTPDSYLSKNNKAVPISYAWGDANLKELEKSIEILKPGVMASLHINDLCESYRHGVACFLETDGINESCQKRMMKHYSNLDKSIISAFNEKMA